MKTTNHFNYQRADFADPQCLRNQKVTRKMIQIDAWALIFTGIILFAVQYLK